MKKFTEAMIQNDKFGPGYSLRLFKAIPLSDGYKMSVQASKTHYSSPSKTVPLEEYTHMEVAFLDSEGEFVETDEVSDVPELVELFHEHYEGTVYSFVPVILIQALYEEKGLI